MADHNTGEIERGIGGRIVALIFHHKSFKELFHSMIYVGADTLGVCQ